MDLAREDWKQCCGSALLMSTRLGTSSGTAASAVDEDEVEAFLPLFDPEAVAAPLAMFLINNTSSL